MRCLHCGCSLLIGDNNAHHCTKGAFSQHQLLTEARNDRSRVYACVRVCVCDGVLVQKEQNAVYNEEEVIFFERQLDLYGRLCYVSCSRTYWVAQKYWHTFCTPYNFIKYRPIFELYSLSESGDPTTPKICRYTTW